MTRIDLGAIWQDAMGLGRRNAELILPIAGMFLLLPGLLSAWYVPTMPMPKEATLANMTQAINAYVGAYWPYLLGHMAITGLGSLAIFALLLRAERPTVAESLRIAALALPVYLLATLGQSLMLTVGFFAFIVPGLYLLGRTALIAPIAAAENGANPFTVLARSFAATRGNGWRIFALMAVILVVGLVVQSVVVGLVSVLLKLLVGGQLAQAIAGVVSGLISTVIALATLLAGAALYRRLTVLPLVPHTH